MLFTYGVLTTDKGPTFGLMALAAIIWNAARVVNLAAASGRLVMSLPQLGAPDCAESDPLRQYGNLFPGSFGPGGI